MLSKSSGEGSKKAPIFKQKAHKRAILWDQQKGLCYYCKRPMRRRERSPSDFNYPDDATLDHKLARANGGTNNIKNLCLSCFECNSKKGDSLDEFSCNEWKPPELRSSRDQYEIRQGTTSADS